MRARSAQPSALSLLAACLLPAIGALAIDSARSGLLVVAAELLIFGGLAQDRRATGRRIALAVVAGLSVGVSTWLYGGHHLEESLGAALRVLAIASPSALLSARVLPTELGDQLAQLLHLPARPVVAAVAALQQLDSIDMSWQQIQRARRARGLGIDGNPLRRARALAGGAFALLVTSMRHTGQMATAMDARGFATATDRTWAGPASWEAADWLMVGTASAFAVLPWFG